MAVAAPLTLDGVIARQATDRPDVVVVTFEGAGLRPDETRTFRQLLDNGRRLAAGLQAKGLQPGDALATLLANHAEFIDLMVACSLLNVMLVPIDPRTRGDRLIYMIGAAGCKGVVAGDYALSELLAVRARIDSLQWIAGLPTDEGNATAEQLVASGVIPYTEISRGGDRHADFPGSAPDSALELIYTSGTTGDPKGIVLTHRRYVETAMICPGLFGFPADERMYSGLSLTHANAQVITLGTALVNALPCVLSRRFSKSRLWDIVRTYGCTSLTLLGGMTTAIYAELPKPDDADNPVRMVISAGMPAAIWPAFARRFGVRVYEFYGAAEGGLCGNPPGVGPVGSIGKPVPTLDYRLVDDNGQDVEKNAMGERVGELLFRAKDGAPFKVEYHGNPEASARKCANGWLHMGDVVREDRDGWLYFLFRKGGGIRRNGEFIDTALIEKTIAEIPDVDDVYVYGVASANGVPGEKDVVAAVVPTASARGSFDVQGVFEICRQKLGSNAVPGRLQILNQIPKTASEKPQDRFLIEALDSDPGSVHRDRHAPTTAANHIPLPVSTPATGDVPCPASST